MLRFAYSLLAVVAALVIGTTTAWGQQVLTWQFNGVANSGTVVDNFGTSPTNTTLTDFIRTGVTANPTANVFDSNNWAAGTSPDANKFVSFTITPTTSRVLYLTTLSFSQQRSGTGPTDTVVRMQSGASIIESSVSLAIPTSTATSTFNFVDTITRDVIRFSWHGYNSSAGAETYRQDNVALTFAPGSSVPQETLNIALTADARLYSNSTNFDLTGNISGSFSTIKEGFGIISLGGANNTFTGGTIITAGTLNITNTTGSGTGTGSVIVAGGLLQGNHTSTGNIAGATTINSGAAVQGGNTTNAVGTLKFGNNLSVAGGGTINIRIADASTVGTLNGGQSSIANANNKLAVTGTLSVDSLSNFVIDGTGATFVGGSTYSYLIATGGAVNAVDITDSGRFVFNNFNLGVDTSSIRLQNSGANLYLNFTTPVPEPGLLFGLSAGLLAVAGVVRKRLRG